MLLSLLKNRAQIQKQLRFVLVAAGTTLFNLWFCPFPTKITGKPQRRAHRWPSKNWWWKRLIGNELDLQLANSVETG
jgi:hypothetical protein